MIKQYRLTWFNRRAEKTRVFHGDWHNDRQTVVDAMNSAKDRHSNNVYSIEMKWDLICI
jgi:hypothetical protein